MLGSDPVQVNIYEAKTRLSELLERAASGEVVVIARAGKPVARLTAMAPAEETRSGIRLGGLKKSRLGLKRGFHSPLSDDDLLSG